MMPLCVIFCCFGVLASLVSQQLTTASEASPRSLQDRPKTAHDAPRMRVSEGSLRRHNRSPNKPKRRSKCVTWRTRTFRATELVVKLWPLSTLLSALCSLFTPLILLAVRGPRFARQLSRWLSRRLACMPLWRLLSSQWGSLWGTIRLRGESKYAGGPDANPPSGAARGTPCAVRSM